MEKHMKLEILDAYSIRARLSASILLISPILITLFFLFEESFTVLSSSVIIFVLLAFTNCLPIMQRCIYKKRKERTNYAAKLLYVDDETINEVVKRSYYKKLSGIDESFCSFKNPNDSQEFKDACERAVLYLRNNTRDNHLIQEENINYGFIRNLVSTKAAGIIISFTCLLLSCVYLYIILNNCLAISDHIIMSCVVNALLLLFWVFFVKKDKLDIAGKEYAKALIYSIDSIDFNKK